MQIPSPLTIVPAVAGSGKTYYLQTELARRIQYEGLATEKYLSLLKKSKNLSFRQGSGRNPGSNCLKCMDAG